MVPNLVKKRYSLQDLQKISHVLSENNSLYFPAFDNGLFSAAAVKDSNQYTGYQAAWVRDNIHIAHAHYLLGTDDEKQIAVKTVKCLAKYFYKEKMAFEQIIENNSAPKNQKDRPHIRFNGQSLERIKQEWNHAQNDALGYFLWLYSKLVHDLKIFIWVVSNVLNYIICNMVSTFLMIQHLCSGHKLTC